MAGFGICDVSLKFSSTGTGSGIENQSGLLGYGYSKYWGGDSDRQKVIARRVVRNAMVAIFRCAEAEKLAGTTEITLLVM